MEYEDSRKFCFGIYYENETCPFIITCGSGTAEDLTQIFQKKHAINAHKYSWKRLPKDIKYKITTKTETITTTEQKVY